MPVVADYEDDDKPTVKERALELLHKHPKRVYSGAACCCVCLLLIIILGALFGTVAQTSNAKVHFALQQHFRLSNAVFALLLSPFFAFIDVSECNVCLGDVVSCHIRRAVRNHQRFVAGAVSYRSGQSIDHWRVGGPI